MTTYNDCVEMATRELTELGIGFTLEDRGKHQMLHWEIPSNYRPFENEKRQYPLPTTPSDSRAALNCRAEIRRMLREDGLLKDNSEEEEIEAKNAERHLFKKMKRLEERLEGERRSVAEQFTKLREDFEAMAALMQSGPSVTSATPNAAAEAVMATYNQFQPKTLANVPPLLIDLLTPETDWDALEAECAAHPRLPPRDGYRILPERYVRVNKTKRNPEANPVAKVTTPKHYSYKRTAKNQGKPKRELSLERLAALRERLEKGEMVPHGKKGLATEG